jgi:hypothetical protein
MPVIQFTYSKEGTPGGQTHDLKFDMRIGGARLNYETLRDAEAAFLRWFQANNPKQAVIMWKASTEGEGIVSEYRAYLAYGTAKSISG